MNTFIFAQSITQRIDSAVNSFHEANPEVSISVGFLQNGEEFYTAYGHLSREDKTKINKHTVFEIASITKIMTGNLIAQAALEGRLKVDDYIDDYLPAAYQLDDNIQGKITIADLASHQSGLPDVDFSALIEKDAQQPTAIVDEELLVSMINSCDTLKNYGSYRYSTVGYTLIGQILEKLYETTYAQLIREKITKPLNMTRTYTTEFDVDNVATGYNGEGGEQELFNWNIVGPAGLVKSTTADMMKYMNALLGENSTLAKAALLTEIPYFKEENEAIGLGTKIIRDSGNTVYLKSGDSMGQSSMLCYNRAANWGILIFINQNNSKMRNDMLNTLYESILK
ncbi:hypothetical protein GCM10011506_00690 [Marivirga lumbricoides]|uniref:Beta-lactamase-related domain-containing protein n=2 Tax=Marivirga lumbricoides TaxID=1046115 RepID=A0ABQ1L9S2_9BACT|nr:hypothetical protein GCM10011506_00690 [Marivirga lumbricoides]